jgi:hypothetical protein
MRHFCPFRLTSSCLMGVASSATIGALGLNFGVGGLAAGHPMKPNVFRKLAVFAAAPIRWRRTGPTTATFVRL